MDYFLIAATAFLAGIVVNWIYERIKEKGY